MRPRLYTQQISDMIQCAFAFQMANYQNKSCKTKKKKKRKRFQPSPSHVVLFSVHVGVITDFKSKEFRMQTLFHRYCIPTQFLPISTHFCSPPQQGLQSVVCRYLHSLSSPFSFPIHILRRSPSSFNPPSKPFKSLAIIWIK